MAAASGAGKRQMTGRKPYADWKPRSDGWTAARRKRFIDVLRETGHVTLAAKAAGRPTPGTAYGLRRRDPEFAAEWDQAVEDAKSRIESALVARALESVAAMSAELDGGAPTRPLDFDQLLQLLKFYQAGPNERRRGGPQRRYATREETDAALMEKLDFLEARVKAREKKAAAERKALRQAQGGALGQVQGGAAKRAAAKGAVEKGVR